jgi:hypothetical protein
MPKLPKLAERTIERNGRPGKTTTGPVPDRFGYQASQHKEQSQP